MLRPVRACAPIALLLALCAPPASAATRSAEAIPDRYVVVYRDSVANPSAATDRRERAQGFRARHRYAHALKGFAARLNAGQVRALRRDPNVDYVAPDLRVEVAAETVPVGLKRIGASDGTAFRAASGVAVAVIDTGVDLAHADLKPHAVNGVNCIDGSKPAQDDHGHGTHVAGTIAAANNGSGVVGVAPGTTVYAVKVLDARGSGSTSSVVCGIDWVTKNAGARNIGVANMSLGGAGKPLGTCSNTTDPEHAAICRSTAPRANGEGGVAYAVAAGNDGWDFDYLQQPDIPAAYPQVVTVTAMGDTDGTAGGTGSSCSRERDDYRTTWSNYAARTSGSWPGAPHTMAAPGLCIVSTKMGGGTTSMSGTSMATPHVAGALALCLNDGGTSGACAGLATNDPVAFIAKLTSTDAAYGFVGDPKHPVSSSRFYGYLLHSPLSGLGGTPGDTTAPETSITAATVQAADASFSFASSESGSTFECRLDASPWASCSSPTQYSGLAAGSHVFEVRAIDAAGNVDPSPASHAFSVASSTSFSLSVRHYKVKGQQRADLTWSGATATSVDVFRNGARITTTANDGAHTDSINSKGGGTYTYRVCNAGTTTCSNDVTVTF